MSRTKFIAMMRAFHAHVFQILWPRLARARLISFTDFPSTGRPLFYHRGHAPKASPDVGGKQPEIKAKFWRPLRIRRTSRLGQFAVQALHEPASGAGVPPAAGASRPSIRRGRDARAGSRDGCPTSYRSLFMVPMPGQFATAFHESERYLRPSPLGQEGGAPKFPG